MLIHCPLCNSENIDEAIRCSRCGGLLVVVRATRHIDMAEREITHGELAAAQANLDQANAAIRDIGDANVGQELIIARAHYLQGLLYYHKSQTAKAADEAHMAASISEGREAGKHLLAEAMNLLGNIEYLHGNMSVAHDYYWRGLLLAEQVHAHTLVVKLWNNLGSISIVEGRPYEALFRYNKAAQIAEIDNNQLLLAVCYQMLCYIYIVIGPLSKGLDYCRRLTALLPLIENHLQRCWAIIAIATVYRYCGKLDEAKAHLNMVVELAAQSSNALVSADAQAKLISVYIDEGNFLAAQELAVPLYTNPDTPELSRREAAAQLIQIYTYLGQLDSAHQCMEWLQDVELQHLNDGVERFYKAVAIYHEAAGDWEEAADNYALAIDQSHQRGETFSLGCEQLEYARAIIQHEGDMTEQACELIEHAIIIFRKIGAIHKLELAEAMWNGSLLAPSEADKVTL